MTISDRCRLFAHAALLASALAAAATPGVQAAWRPVDGGHRWTFPADHWRFDGYRTQWWYFTGLLHAEEDPQRVFGYQLTFFRVGLVDSGPGLASAWAARSALMGHAAITDPAAGIHRFTDVLHREIPLLAGFGAFPEPRIAWCRAPAGTDDLWTLEWSGEGFDLRMRDDARGLALHLLTRAEGPPVLQGPGGVSRKGRAPAQASLYYSFPRLGTAGSLTVGARTWRVRGTSWMDREASSSSLAPDQRGWDWFGLRLADGRSLMMYLMRGAQGGVDVRNASLIAADGSVRYLREEEWSVRATDTWISPHTGARYPSRWIAAIPADGVQVEIVPRLADQENRARRPAGLSYWEGAVELRDPAGLPAGEGYVELTGYGEGTRPPV